VAKAATAPTTTLDDDIERALLVELLVPPTAATAGDAEAAGDPAAVPAADGLAEDAVEALLSAALRSCGIIRGVDSEPLRSMDPSSLRTSALAARKLRVYMTFSAI